MDELGLVIAVVDGDQSLGVTVSLLALLPAFYAALSGHRPLIWALLPVAAVAMRRRSAAILGLRAVPPMERRQGTGKTDIAREGSGTLFR